MKAQGSGTVGHAGVVLSRPLSDCLGLTSAFGEVLARPGPGPSGTVAALAAGASSLSDVEAMTAQVKLFGPA